MDEFALIKSRVNLNRVNLGIALISDLKVTPIWAGVKRATNFSKSGVKGAAFFGPIFTPFWPCYGLWSLNVAKNMLLAYLFG